MSGAAANTLANVIHYVLQFVQILVIISIILSWVGDPRNHLVQMFNQIVEPIYRPFRRFTSRIPGPLDWTPIVIFILIVALESSIVAYLKAYARSQGIY